MVRINQSILDMLRAGSPVKRAKKNKYNAKKIVIDGHKFDSLKEGRKYQELKFQQHAGLISNLELQPVFVLQESFKCGNETIRAIKYIADFRFVDSEGETIIIDVKGKKTAVYLIKKKMLLKRYPGINFIET